MRSLIVRRYAYTVVLPRDITEDRTKGLAHLASLVIPRHPYVTRFLNEGLRTESKTSLPSSSPQDGEREIPTRIIVYKNISISSNEIGYRWKSLLFLLSLLFRIGSLKSDRRKVSHGRERKRMITAERRTGREISSDDCSGNRNMGREIDVQPVRTIDFLDYPPPGFIGTIHWDI